MDILQKRVQSIETDIKDVHTNTQYVANEVRLTRAGKDTFQQEDQQQQKHSEGSNRSSTTATTTATTATSRIPSIRRNPSSSNTNILNGLMQTSNTQWSLSLTPKGLRIDTNIISLHDLYDILLSGVSQFDLSGSSMHSHHHSHHDMDSVSSSSSTSSSIQQPESPRPDTATIVKKKPLWKSRLKTFPLYSSWEPEQRSSSSNNRSNSNSYNTIMDSSTSFDPLQQTHSEETLQEMIKIFGECFLCLPCPDPACSIAHRFKNGILDPLLANSVFAWTARHGAIYHNLFPGQDPNQVGQHFFLKAKSLVKERFMKTSIDTMHSLIIMYIYAIGIPSEHKAEVESEAYIYLGLAIRMCLDLKMHQESKSSNPFEQEKHRRFFWVTYFLETLGSIHSDKPFSLPPKNTITVNFPTVMQQEQFGESKYRVEFMIQRFKITLIYRNIIYKTAEEKPLLSQISAIDKELEKWHQDLPEYFKYEPGDIHKRRWDSTSFREQACIKLNFEYNFQLCQLYGLFFNSNSSSNNNNDRLVNEEEQQEPPSTIEVLSRDICLKAARNTVELLECWVQLKQLWCHFSLENLMMTTMIYGNILTQPNSSEQEMAKSNLEKMAKILLSSPVRHHKYVLTLVNRIKTMFQETLHTDLVTDADMDNNQQSSAATTAIKTESTNNNVISSSTMDNSPSSSSPLPAPTAPPSSITKPLPSQAQQSTIIAPPPTIAQASHDSNSTQPISLTNQFTQQQAQQRNPVFNVLDVASASSPFDIHKTDAFSDDMHFSDFVYTPTLLDYGTATNNTGLLSAVMDTSAYNQQPYDKKPDYPNAAAAAVTVSSPYLRQRYSPPYTNNFGYNAQHNTPSRTHHSSSVTPSPPSQHQHHINNNNYHHPNSSQAWMNVDNSNNNHTTTTSHNAPVMLNQPLDTHQTHPYLRIPPQPQQQQPQQHHHNNLKATPPPHPPPSQMQPSTHQPLPPTGIQTYYNNNTDNNGTFGGNGRPPSYF